ncbi:MAG: phosphate ABC transporter substrate-binding protein PstS [Elusimicrobia bacterium]|nr:phosphate ABC transporter substrate-binding protein PstS [Elusimicrobiota bacterium]
MKFTVALLSVAVMAAPAMADSLLINGAGSTFVYPAMTKWFAEYQAAHKGVEFNYQSIGSGGGIRMFTQQTVDFGASDAPMNDEQLKAAPGAVLQLPDVLGGAVAMYNVDGVKGKLKFTQKAIAGIFLGTITKWNDPEIAKHNPGVKLPAADIVVVHRSDGSGTTYCWTDFLSKASPAWAKKVGKGTSVDWPVGVGAKGSEGVSGMVRQTPNSIGYVELIYALQNSITYGLLQNKAGRFIDCSLKTVTAAAASTARTMPKDFRVSITNAPGALAYPASTYSWVLVYVKGQDAAKQKSLEGFLKWMLGEGQKTSAQLGYAPLPKNVVAKELAAMRRLSA